MSTLRTVFEAGPLRGLAASTLVNNLGNGAFAAASVVYLSRVVGLSAALIGTGLTIGAVCGLLSSLPAGMLADRRDPKVAAGVLAVAAGLVSALYAAVNGPVAFVLVAAAFALLERASIVARQALVGTVFTGPGRTTARALLRSVTNVGAGLGTALAAIVLALNSGTAFRVLFLANAVTFVLGGVFLLRLPWRVEAEPVPERIGEPVAVVPLATGTTEAETTCVDSAGTEPAVPSNTVQSNVVAPDTVTSRPALRDVPYAVVSIVNALLTVHIVILEVILPLWVVERTDAPAGVVAALLLANTVLVVLLQVPISRRYETIAAAVRGLRVAAVLLATLFVLLQLSTSAAPWLAVVLLVLGTVAQSGAEIVQGATSWPLSYDLASPDRIGEYQGLFGMSEQVIQIVGPAGLTLALITWTGPGALVLAVVFVVVALGAPWVATRLLRERAVDA